MVELKFRCCFCNNTIESSNVDPADVNVLINIDKPKDTQYDQDFYCHIICFKKRIQPIVSLYIEHLGK